MINHGLVKPGSTIEFEFDTFAGATGASITMSGLAVTDIEVYKDGSVTQRASDNGYTLLDTDGIDFDGLTGIHGFSISLADNTTAGFWAAGSRYTVVVSSVTVDSQTVSFIAGKFRIGYEGAILDTTIATLASQTSFTLTAGPADDNALNGCVAVIHDVASAVQIAIGVVLDYTGSTKTVTLGADPGVFTMAATDNISFFPPTNIGFVGGTPASEEAIVSGTVEASPSPTTSEFDIEVTVDIATGALAGMEAVVRSAAGVMKGRKTISTNTRMAADSQRITLAEVLSASPAVTDIVDIV